MGGRRGRHMDSSWDLPWRMAVHRSITLPGMSPLLRTVSPLAPLLLCRCYGNSLPRLDCMPREEDEIPREVSKRQRASGGTSL